MAEKENNGSDKRPKVGVGALVLRGDQALFGRRKGSHNPGVYGTQGGHLEYMESLETAVRREITEEAGIEVENIRFLCLTNFKVDGKHYVDIGFVANWKNGEPELREPDRCEKWDWHDLNKPPSPLMEVVANYVEAYKTGRNYFDN